MRLSLSVATALVVAAVGLTAEADAFTIESPEGVGAGGSQSFGEPGRRGVGTTDGSAPSSSINLDRRRERPDPAGRYDDDPTREPRPLPRGAQIGGGDHGFDNHQRYRAR